MFDIKKSNAIPSIFPKGVLLAGLILIGAALRGLYPNWQPLWWDEGYSAYFATEPIAQMLALTSVDIHPPLYYALLHGWIDGWGAPTPMVLRSFSILAGVATIPAFYWMAASFFSISLSATTQHQKNKPSSEPRRAVKSELARRNVVWLSLLFFVVNPLHIHYSQEIRMYGLALLFTIASSGAFWRLLTDGQEESWHGNVRPEHSPVGVRSSATSPWQRLIDINSIIYILATTAGLYTLYYSALIPIAQLIFAGWLTLIRRVRPVSTLFTLLAAQLIIGLLYLPWLVYAAQRLFLYVSDKIGADNDTPLGLAEYLGRHILAFFTGHAWFPFETVEWLGGPIGWAALVLLGIGVVRWLLRARSSDNSQAWRQLNPIQAAWFLLAVPTMFGFLLNLRLPFFPEGGERLLLIVLPYFVLLIAAGSAAISKLWLRYSVISAFLIIWATGISLFYTIPRHDDRDYRGIVQYVTQNGQNKDSVLTLFPWQIGYWRAYLPTLLQQNEQEQADTIGPRPYLIHNGPASVSLGDNPSGLEWNESLQQEVDALLSEEGSVWFPAPLGLGSDLPIEIETYLWGKAEAETISPDPSDRKYRLINFEREWANPTTFLTAWRQSAAFDEVESPAENVSASFGSVLLQNGGLARESVASANELIPLWLTWTGSGSAADAGDYLVTLVLENENGQLWGQRDHRWPPQIIKGDSASTFTVEERTGFVVPAGLPPGRYVVKVGLNTISGSEKPITAGSAASSGAPTNKALVVPLMAQPLNGSGPHRFVEVGRIGIEVPERPLVSARLAFTQPEDGPTTHDGITILGSRGFSPESSFLAGTEIPLQVTMQNGPEFPAEQHLYVSLLDKNGAGVAGWEGWPLPDYPTTSFQPNALVKVPADVQIPAEVATGQYTLIAGLLDPSTGEKAKASALGMIQVQQRPALFERPESALPLSVGSARFGAHADLIGFIVEKAEDDAQEADYPEITVLLTWHIEQSLLPAHQLFIHLVDPTIPAPALSILAQHDGSPESADGAAAPTGSWRSGEYLTTRHQLVLPEEVQFDVDAQLYSEQGHELLLRVGLYLPETGVRLPVSINGQVAGDSVVLE